MGKPKWMHPLYHDKPRYPGETQEEEDIWQGATDRGQGPEFQHPFDEAAAQVENMKKLGAPLTPSKLEITLPPEVLAQLQRIEDMLTNLTSVVELVLEKSTIRPSDHQHG